MDDDDDFAELVEAMCADVEPSQDTSKNSLPISTPHNPVSSAFSKSTDFSRTPMTEESENISKMMQRIKELENELAKEKVLNGSSCSSQPKISPTPMVKPVKKSSLTDLNFNVFTAKPKNASQPAKPESSSASKLTLADIGLSDDSSDDDEDFAQNLSKTGRDLKRKLAAQKEDEFMVKKSRPTERSDNPNSLADFAAPVPVSQKPVELARPKSRLVEKCGISGIRISNPTMTADIAKDTIGEKQYFKLSQLATSRGQITSKTDWFTIGVIVQKLPPKQAANGAPFSIWKLSDLEDTVHLVTLFLFADAHKEDWKIPVRTVVAILNPSLMPKKDGKDDLAISVNVPGRMVEMGFSEDMGICKGRTRAGDPCTNLVNIAKAEYCVYHLQAALQKITSNRMELQTHFSGVQPKTSKVKEAANGYFYGGKLFSSSPIAAKSSPSSRESPSTAPKKSEPISAAAQAIINEARNLVKAQLSEAEKKTLDNLTAKDTQLNQFLVTDGPGARNLVRSVTKKETESKPVKYISPGQLLKDHKASMEKLMASQNQPGKSKNQLSGSTNQAINRRNARPITGISSTKDRSFSSCPISINSKKSSLFGAAITFNDDFEKELSYPRTPDSGKSTNQLINQRNAGTSSTKDRAFPSSPISRNSKKSTLIGTVINLDDDFGEEKSVSRTPDAKNLSVSQARAWAKLSAVGKTTIPKSDPNRMSSGLSARAKERIEQLTAGKKAAEMAPAKERICNLQEDDELRQLLQECSQKDDLCQLNEIDRMESYFQRSAAKEDLEEAMEATKEMECSVVTCKKCKYTATSLSDKCFKERHDHIKHKATKRFYQCKKCSKRKPSFSTVMPSPCKSCGTQNFQRCGMLAYERKGPKLDSEILHVRGEEDSGNFVDLD